jgi:hypothetical protein
MIVNSSKIKGIISLIHQSNKCSDEYKEIGVISLTYAQDVHRHSTVIKVS